MIFLYFLLVTLAGNIDDSPVPPAWLQCSDWRRRLHPYNDTAPVSYWQKDVVKFQGVDGMHGPLFLIIIISILSISIEAGVVFI